jgi:hypothetical protein
VVPLDQFLERGETLKEFDGRRGMGQHLRCLECGVALPTRGRRPWTEFANAFGVSPSLQRLLPCEYHRLIVFKNFLPALILP